MSTQTLTVTEFLLARIAEDEARANGMQHRTDPEGGNLFYACPATRDEPYGDLEYGEDACDCGLAAHKGRALAECAAKRRIVTEYVHAGDVSELEWESGESGTAWDFAAQERGLEFAVKALASVYADHPDFREEWR